MITKQSRFEQDDDDADDAPRKLRRPMVDLAKDEQKSCDIDLTKEESIESTFDLPTSTSQYVDTNHVLGALTTTYLPFKFCVTSKQNLEFFL